MAGPMITRGLSSLIWRSSSLALTSRPLLIRPLPSAISARRSIGDESGISGRQESVIKQGSYEGHGQTSVSILNDDCEGINMIDSYAQDGFRLSDDTKILGPCIIFPTAVLGWRIRGVEDINEDALSLFTLLDPRLDLLVIGHGGQAGVRDPVSPKVILRMKKLGLNIEVLTTEKAVSTYNFLVEEGRIVAAALIPPESVKIMDIDVVETKERYRKLLSHPDHDWIGGGTREKR